MTRSRNEPEIAGLAAEAGVPYVPRHPDDPIGDWIGLMEAVEALCPRWPQREPTIGERFEL
ncbi:hypothetical protein [Dokdonella ginsengisoli]|uniref:Uncharacterized protein n=1 Tax=Dokdonella ginsengisoli TaxID=363846 RepID=A0ABV9QX31_9GAMM